jgi:hypothetical protein
MSLLQIYWYGNKPHGINTPFILSVLTRLTPFAKSAIWNKLPIDKALTSIDEALALQYLQQAQRLHEWKAGMTIKQYLSRMSLRLVSFVVKISKRGHNLC